MADPTAIVTGHLDRDADKDAVTLVIKNAEPLVIGGLAAMATATGKVEFADDVAGLLPVGLVVEGKHGDNQQLTGNSGGTISAKCKGGTTLKRVSVATASSIADVGKYVYATDGQTLTLVKPANGLPQGMVINWIGSTTCDVYLFNIVESKLNDTAIGSSSSVVNAIDSTTGLADAGKLIKTDATGYLSDTFLTGNLVLESELISATTGSADGNKPIETNVLGYVDPSFTGQDVTKEPTGFVNRSTTLSWTNGTRTVTITGSHVVYSAGVRISKATASIVIPNSVGLHWIYYAASGYALTSSLVVPTPGAGDVLIATVYWDGTTGMLADKRYGLGFSWSLESYLDATEGAKYGSGLVGNFSDANYDVQAGTIWDKDIQAAIPNVTTTAPILHRVGSDWAIIAPDVLIWHFATGNVYYDNAGTLTAMDSNYYTAYWVFATTNVDYPVISIMGQSQAGSIAAALASNTFEALDLTGLPYASYKLLYRVMVKNNPIPYQGAQDFRKSPIAARHGSLLELTSNDHPQYQLVSGLIATSAGVADAGKAIKTNSAGIIDTTILGKYTRPQFGYISAGIYNISPLVATSSVKLFSYIALENFDIVSWEARPRGFDAAAVAGLQDFELRIDSSPTTGGIVTLNYEDFDDETTINKDINATAIVGGGAVTSGLEVSMHRKAGGTGFTSTATNVLVEFIIKVQYYS